MGVRGQILREYAQDDQSRFLSLIRIRAAALALLTIATSAMALTPDQIALVVNRNLPASGALAAYYAKARGIPDGRIIELSLPITEEISFDMYERAVVPPIREFLQKNDLVEKVTCLVTFHGVPFRIGPRINTPREIAELAGLRDERDKVLATLASSIGELERFVAELNPAFAPKSAGGDLLVLAGRADAAFRAANQPPQQLNDSAPSDPATRERNHGRLMAHMQQLTGPGSIIEQLRVGAPPPADAPTEAIQEYQRLLALKEENERVRALAGELYDRRYDPQSRSDLRELTRQSLGLFGYARLLDTQLTYFDSDYTVSALDSELTLLWWNYYSRKHWGPNPLHFAAQPTGLPPAVMVMRLDGPQAGTARDIIVSSLKAEKEGLRGRVVLDTRGIAPLDAQSKPDAYGAYDQTIRNLAEIIRTRTKLSLALDDNPAVLPPRALGDVAIYCGWYSLRNYVPACSFSPGAVGYHVASLEMVSLRGPEEKGWVKGLLNDGIASTMGAVAEPYLHAFPPADGFFPLLLTGKLTLAEVYWKSCPVSSWMISMIGDPLYTPYKNRPALKIEDLPAELQAIFTAAATAPAASTQASVGNGR